MNEQRQPITGLMNKIAGGIVIIPMFVVSIINTLIPGALRLGGFTTAFFSPDSTPFIISVLLFIAGTQLDIHEMGPALKRGGLLSLTRVLIGVLAEVIVLALAGPQGFLGVSALA